MPISDRGRVVYGSLDERGRVVFSSVSEQGQAVLEPGTIVIVDPGGDGGGGTNPNEAPVESEVITLPNNVVMRVQSDGSLVVLGNYVAGASKVELEPAGNLKAMQFVKGAGFSLGENSVTATKFYKGKVAPPPTQPVEEGLLFYADFTNNGGSTTNTINDSVSNVPCTLVGVTHGADGWLDDEGLTLGVSSYVTLGTNTQAFRDKIDWSKGITIEYIAYGFDGTNFRTEPSASISSTRNANGRSYKATDGTTKTKQYESYWYDDPYDLRANRDLNDVKNPKSETSVMVARYYPNGNVDLMINGWSGVTAATPPADFLEQVDLFAASPLYIRRNIVGVNTIAHKIHSLKIYNKVFTNSEVLQRYENFKNSEPLSRVEVYPASVTMDEGEDRTLAVVAVPSRYSSLISNEFESLNPGYVKVDTHGKLTGVYSGTTQVSITSTYEDKEIINYIPVTVGTNTISPPAATRTITGISINRKPETSLEVGETFLAMATTLPFDVFNDNYVIWQSSDSEVCTVNFGVLEPLKPGTAVITAYDASKTYSASFTVTVVAAPVTTIQESEIYNVPLATYNIQSDLTNPAATTTGIQAALDYAKTQGYKKIVFPYGRYAVTPDSGKDSMGTIYLPSDMIVDFSNSRIEIAANTKTTNGGYSIFVFEKVRYTKLTRAHIYGEADRFPTVTVPDEASMSVMIKDAYKSGIESCTVSKSVGFNIATHSNRIAEGELGRHPSKDNWEAGGIDDAGVLDNSVTTNIWRNKTYLNVGNLKETYQLGYTQGYFGYPYLRSRLYSIYFYDASYNFVTAHKYNLQFYNYKSPANVRYAKIVIYQEAAPTNHDTDFSAVAMLRSWTMPTSCYIRDCVIEDNKSTGIAMTGGQGWIVENNRFARNAGRMPACDIDWEDGWEASQGDICRGNTFTSGSGIIVSGVCNIAIYDNIFNYSHLHVWERTANWKAYNNTFSGKGNNRNLTIGCQADSYFARNVLQNVTYSNPPTKQHGTGAEVKYQVHVINNTQL